MAYKTPKPKQATEENFNNIIGVDLRSDNCDKNHSPGAVNVCRSNDGRDVLETIAGFRQRVVFPVIEGESAPDCFGMHEYRSLSGSTYTDNIILHAGERLYKWTNYPVDADIDTGLTCIYGSTADKISPTVAKSVVFGNKLYIADGVNFLVYDTSTVSKVAGTVPTLWVNKNPDGSGGAQYQQRNILQPKFKEDFIGNGTATVYVLSVANLDVATVTITINGATKTEGTHFTVDRTAGTINFAAGSSPHGAPANTSEVIVTASKTTSGYADRINKCKEMMVYDNRLFMTNNPAYPNTIFWSMLDDATYFGELTYTDETGKGNAQTVALQLLSNGTFLSIKNDTEGSYCVFTPADTDTDYNPKVYTPTYGNGNVGTLDWHTARVFFDDNVFLSKTGVKAISKTNLSSVNTGYTLDRSIEHRSTYIDKELLREDLSNCHLEQFGFYLVIACPSGNVYLADSRRRPIINGVQEYEWFVLKNVGKYTGQEINADGIYEGGTFQKPQFMKSYANNLFFGSDACLMSFNFDQTESDGKLSVGAYTFDGRDSGWYIETPFSDFGVANIIKSFSKRGNLLRTETYSDSGCQVSYRTEKSFYVSLPVQFNSGEFDFERIDFSRLTFNTLPQVGHSLKKIKAKKFIFLQIKISSIGLGLPFGLRDLIVRLTYDKLTK